MTVNDNLLIEMSSNIGLTGMTQNKNDLAVMSFHFDWNYLH